MRIELRELRCLAALVVLVTAPGAGQVARVGVPGRVDYNPYFAIGLADPRLRTVLQSTDPQVLLGVVEQTVLSVGQGEVAAAVPPAALGVLAADRLAALRAFGVADSLLRLWERVRTVPAGPGEPGANVSVLAFGIQNYQYALAFRGLSNAEAAHRILDSLSRLPIVTSAEFEFLASLGRDGADSARDRFLQAAGERERLVYLQALIEIGDPAAIPIFADILARGAQAYGPVGGSEDRVAAGLLRVGTLEAVIALRDALARAESNGTYDAQRSQFGYDAVDSWRSHQVPDLTGHTIAEWIDILSRSTEPPPVAAQAVPSPLAWNLTWRKDVPPSQAQVSFEVGNVAGGRDPRTLQLSTLRLNGSIGAFTLRPRNQGNVRWTGPWVDVVFRQHDAILLVPPDAKAGDAFAVTLTGTLADGTRITAPATIRVEGR